MDDLDTRWNRRPEVTVDHENILMVDDHVIELPDIVPQMLSDFIKMGSSEIHTQLALLENMRRAKSDFKIEPTILVGRFALLGNEMSVFQYRSLPRLELYPNEAGVDDLENEYRPFWLAAEATLYEPRIYYKRETKDARFRGTWLGIVFKNN